MIILQPAHPQPYLPSISDGGGLQVIKEDIFTPRSLLWLGQSSCWLRTAVVVVDDVVVTRVLGRSSGRHLPPLLLGHHTTAATTRPELNIITNVLILILYFENWMLIMIEAGCCALFELYVSMFPSIIELESRV